MALRRAQSLLRLMVAVTALAILMAPFASARAPKANATQQWQSLITQAMEANSARDYRRGITPAQQALRLARQRFGNRDLRTLISLDALALLYLGQNSYSEAEPLFREALQVSRETLGPRHIQTLISIDGLATVYRGWGRYDEAEPLYREALQTRREMLGARHPDALSSLNDLAMLYQFWGRYDEAEPLYREALQASRETLGPRHPQTLNNLDGLAHVYQFAGRPELAEPLYREVLQANRETLGPHDPKTLYALDNLATFYAFAGRFEQAEPLFQEVLQERDNVLGVRHPDTVGSLNTLAFLYQMQGRYAEAEPLLRKALRANNEMLGPHNPQTVTSRLGLGVVLQSLGHYGEAESFYREALQVSREGQGPRGLTVLLSLNRLASIYLDQGRFSEAEQLYREALKSSRETFGPRHISTLLSLGTLASIYQGQGRYSEAEPLFLEALKVSREMLGSRHPVTSTNLHNLALLYKDQRRYGEAEPLFLESLQISREGQGPRHPNTLISLGALADLYSAQGRYAEAEQLYSEALQASFEVLGIRDPQTLKLQLNSVMLLVNQGRSAEAVRTLQQMEPRLLGWIGQELYSTETGAVRRRLVSSQAPFQDVVLTLAIAENSGEARRLAGNVMLRFKLLQSEEETYLGRLTRRSQDPQVRLLADEIGKLRAALVASARAEPDEFDKALPALQGLEPKRPATRAEPGAFDKTLQALEAKQRELAKFSPDYEKHLRVLTANFEDLRAAVPVGAVLIEFRQFRPVDFRTKTPGEPRFAAILLAGSDDPVVADLGPIAELGQPAPPDDAAAAALYSRLFEPFEQKLADARTVYVAPDGILNLVPFARLKLADGRYWCERQEVRLLQSGRDLLRDDSEKRASGLVAIGGIDFGVITAGAKSPSSVVYAAANSGAVKRAAENFRNGFPQLTASGEEATEVKQWYQRLRKDEAAEVWSGTDASKARLMAMRSPPRVLHLATHGFYFAGEARDPMLQSGVALAGANRALATQGADGMLFALEAQGLNLEGSELVVLSACDTARGSIDYSEGVYGLVRALRTAGARNVLVTLWKLNDGEARDFMVAFYKNWLNQVHSDPAKALRDTQLFYLKQANLRDPRVWAPYILIE
jgi:CHAT domain-containing protein/tetratricopeptide (TPR) repeat protein